MGISFGINWKLEEQGNDSKASIKLYELPKLDLTDNLSEIRKPIRIAQTFKRPHSHVINSDGIMVENNTLPIPTLKNDNLSLIVQSNKRTYLMPTQLISYPLKAFIRTGRYWQDGFVGVLNNNEFENGTYQLGLIIKNGQNIKTYFLNDSIIVNNTKPKSVKTNW